MRLFFTSLYLVLYCIFPSEVRTQNANAKSPTELEKLLYNENWKDIGGEANSWWIKKDRNDFIWFNSAQGLCRYDGNSYYYFTDKNKGILNGIVRAFDFKNRNQVWLGMKDSGLHLFDLNTEEIVHSFYNNPTDSTSLSSSKISALVTDHNQCLWVITRDNMLHSLPEGNLSFEKHPIPIPTTYPDKTPDTAPGKIIEDKINNDLLWICLLYTSPSPRD